MNIPEKGILSGIPCSKDVKTDVNKKDDVIKCSKVKNFKDILLTEELKTVIKTALKFVAKSTIENF